MPLRPVLLAFLLLAPCAARGEEPAAARVPVVTAKRSVHQVVGPVQTPLSPDLADFFLDHPDLAAAIAREHGLAPYRIERRGARQYWADDGDGTAAALTEVERQEGRRVLYADGVHHSRLFPDIHAEAVIVMEMRPAPRPGCEDHVRSSFDVSVKLRNRFLDGIVGLLPFVQKTVARKFSKAFLVADQVGRLLAQDPRSVARDAEGFGLPEADQKLALRLIASAESQPPSCR